MENMIPGETGLVAPSDDCQAMVAAIRSLLNDPLRLKAMAKAARRYMEDRSFESAFNETWDMYNMRDGDSASALQALAEAS
jgi:glycosyltransferase involved in cell wall biosynthesis